MDEPKPPPGGPQRLPLSFTGSGSEYLRIWIVNLLLTLVTLTLYYPWAKVRRLRYFYGNTHLAGHGFDFHGDPRRMLRGYLLVGALFAVYGAATRASPVAALVALVILAAIWPLLFRASQRFRLTQTSWRGLRFHFAGDTAGAYKALLPAYLPAFAVVAAGALAAPDEAQAPSAEAAAAGVAVLLVSLAAMLCVPLIWWTLKRYQHGHYEFAGERTRLASGIGAFYGVFAKTAAMAIGAGIVAGVGVALVIAMGAALGLLGGGVFKGAAVAAMVVGMLLLYAVVIAVVQPYFASRMQNLVWSHTASPAIGFESALRFRPLFKLTLKNWALVLLTLGLYWPFAAVALARVRLEAVAVLAAQDLDRLVAPQREALKDATGDAAADVFDIDIGM